MFHDAIHAITKVVVDDDRQTSEASNLIAQLEVPSRRRARRARRGRTTKCI